MYKATLPVVLGHSRCRRAGTEVDDEEDAVVLSAHDVGGFNVAMHNAYEATRERSGRIPKARKMSTHVALCAGALNLCVCVCMCV